MEDFVLHHEVINYVLELDNRVGAQGPKGDPGEAAVDALKNPIFSYTGELLSRIDYDDGKYKELVYTNGLLFTSTFFDGSTFSTKTLNYTNGILTHITET